MNKLRALLVITAFLAGVYYIGETYYDLGGTAEVVAVRPEPIVPPVEQEADAEVKASDMVAHEVPTPTTTTTTLPTPITPPAPAPKKQAVPTGVVAETKPGLVASSPVVVASPPAVVASPPAVIAATPAVVASAPGVAKASEPKPIAPVAKPKEVQLIIKDIKITGATAFTEKELTGVVNEFVGKELKVEDTFAIPAKIANHYKSRNLMAIATLSGAITPEGVLTIGVVEMQMTQTEVTKELATLEKLPPDAKTAPAVTPLAAPERPAVKDKATEQKPNDLEAARLIVTPIAESKPPAAAMKPAPVRASDSSTIDETQYILQHYAKQSRQYELIVDNFGNDATGRTRFGAALSLDDNKFSLVGIKSQGSDYLRMAYRWVTGIDDLKFGVQVAKLNYDVVKQLQTAVYQSGDAVKKGAEFIYQLVSEPGQFSTLGFQYITKSTHSVGLNSDDSASTSSRLYSLEWKGSWREMIPGGAVFTYDTVYEHGQVDILGSTIIGGLDVDDGLFSKINFSGTLLQPLGGLGSVFARLSLQQSNKNLDPSERLYLGGPWGVRAYGVGVGAGSQGGFASLEFRQQLDAKTTLAEFYDWGSVRQINDPNPATVLSGYGLSLSQDIGNGITLKGTWARNNGTVPQPNLPQNNDGKLDRNRFWLSMETRF